MGNRSSKKAPTSAACANCGTTDRRRGARGYCDDCDKLEMLKWSEATANAAAAVTEIVNQTHPGRGREEAIRHVIMPIEERLTWFRVHRSRAEGRMPIETIDLEMLARDVARCIGARTKDQLKGCASWFDGFGAEQRQAVYRLLFALRRCRREQQRDWLPSMLTPDA